VVRTIHIRAGEKKRIIFQLSNSLRQTHNFLVEKEDGRGDPSGLVEVRGSNWLFPKPAVTLDLRGENAIEKGAWDTIFSVWVTPEHDTKITITSSPVRNVWVFLIGALILLAIASSLFFNALGG
jgi:hypothetical protein